VAFVEVAVTKMGPNAIQKIAAKMLIMKTFFPCLPLNPNFITPPRLGLSVVSAAVDFNIFHSNSKGKNQFKDDPE
jgi:hypothetical protein